jgi:hypothetical protein
LLQNCYQRLKATPNSLRMLTNANHRRFSGDESFLRDPNAFNDAKNTATLEVIDEPISEVGEKAEDKSRL